MSGGKVTVGGTNYKIIGGKTTIGGTAYTIGRGRTTVNGTNYNIFLKPQTLPALLKSAKKISASGTNASSATATIYAQLSTAGTYYAFAFYIGYLTICKLVSTGSAITKTTLFKAHSSYTDLFISRNVAYLSKRGKTTSTSNVDKFRAGSLLVVTFPGYTVSQVDTILKKVTSTNMAGFDSSSARAMEGYTRDATGKVTVVSVGNQIAFTSTPSASSKTVLYTTATSGNTSLIYMNDTYIGYSTNGSSAANCYGGSLLALA